MKSSSSSKWETGFYFVACPRRGGEAPSLEKAVQDRLFHTKEDADKFAKKISESVGFTYRSFWASCTIQRIQP